MNREDNHAFFLPLILSVIAFIVVISIISFYMSNDTDNLDENGYAPRFITTDISYNVNGGDYFAVIDTKTNLVYLSSVKAETLCPLMNGKEQYTAHDFLKEYKYMPQYKNMFESE